MATVAMRVEVVALAMARERENEMEKLKAVAKLQPLRYLPRPRSTALLFFLRTCATTIEREPFCHSNF
jgi:hypothetical protein